MYDLIQTLKHGIDRLEAALNAPIDKFIGALDEERTSYAAKKMGNLADKLVLAAAVSIMIFDTAMGKRTMPLVVIVALFEVACCAVGDRVRQTRPDLVQKRKDAEDAEDD